MVEDTSLFLCSRKTVDRCKVVEFDSFVLIKLLENVSNGVRKPRIIRPEGISGIRPSDVIMSKFLKTLITAVYNT